MSEEADALAELARHRGLKLVRSRIRTPTKQAYGKYALLDAQGEAVLGDGRQPSASAEEVTAYLRRQDASEWSQSLGLKTVPKRKKAAKRAPLITAPAPELRDAVPGDAAAIVGLLKLLGHETDSAGVRERLKLIDQSTLLAVEGKEICGLCSLAASVHIHRDRPVGRITALVVAEHSRRKGLGRMLVEEALQRLASAGCGMVEVTSNNRLDQAHVFYQHLGFEQTSKRFAKTL
ncbi:MAG: GNAT family N-acetyltransferase [Sphingomicrobium sp.]